MEHDTSSTVHTLQYDSESSGSEFAVPVRHDTLSSNDGDSSDGGYGTSSSEDSCDSVAIVSLKKTRANTDLSLIQGFEGDDPLLHHEFDLEAGHWEYYDDDESEDVMLPLKQTTLNRVPTASELQKEPTSLFPLMRSWSYIPKNSTPPAQR
jgi:hypothetical protein